MARERWCLLCWIHELAQMPLLCAKISEPHQSFSTALNLNKTFWSQFQFCGSSRLCVPMCLLSKMQLWLISWYMLVYNACVYIYAHACVYIHIQRYIFHLFCCLLYKRIYIFFSFMKCMFLNLNYFPPTNYTIFISLLHKRQIHPYFW